MTENEHEKTIPASSEESSEKTESVDTNDISDEQSLELSQPSSSLSEANRQLLANRDAIKAVLQPTSSFFELGRQLQKQQNAIRAILQPTFPLLEFSRQLQEQQNVVRAALNPASSFFELGRQLEQQQNAIKAIFQPTPSLIVLSRQLQGQQNFIKDTLRTKEHLTIFSTRYILPHKSEIDTFVKAILQPSAASLKLSEQFANIQSAAERMRNPWLDIRNGLQSFSAFAELQAMGNTLTKFPAYSDQLTKYLRNDLGDWRDKINWPEVVFSDVAARKEFYNDLGYNQELTDFPSEAFDETLEIAGIGQLTPSLVDLYGEPIPRSSNEEQEIGFTRTNKAHDWLLRLESHIRRFIHAKMVKEFGENWTKQQVPGNILQLWKEKQERYKRNRSTSGEFEIHIIEFADFSDYEPIIVRKDNWTRVFKPYFQRQENVSESFQRLYPIRIDTMHARLISQSDELLLYVEAERLYKACRL